MKGKQGSVKSEKNAFHSFSAFMRRSFLAKILLFFGSLQAVRKESAFIDLCKRFFSKPEIDGKVFRPFRQGISKEIEQSVILNFINNFFEMLLYAPLRLYGMFLMTFSVYTVAIGVGRAYLKSTGLVFSSTYVTGAVLLILSLIFLLASGKKTFAAAVFESRVLSFLLFDLLGLEKRYFEKDRRIEGGYLIAFLCGTLFSVLTVFFPISNILCTALLILFLRVAFLSPESGFLAAVLALPLVPERVFSWMLIAVAFSFFVKLLRGKRNLKTAFYGWILFAFMVLLCFSGWIKPIGQSGASAYKAFVWMLGFFLCHLMMAHRKWVERCASVLSMSALIAALWGTLVFLLRLIPEKYAEIFTFIPENDFPGGFLGAESFGLFVTACFPVFIVRYMASGRLKNRIYAMIAFVPFLVSVVISRSPMVWMAFLLSVLFFLVLRSSVHLITAAVTVAAALLGYFFFLPGSFKEAVSSYSQGFSSSSGTVWKQIVESAGRAFFAVGGDGIYENANFYSHLLVSVGIFGVIFLLFAVVGSWCFAFYACEKGPKSEFRLRFALCGYSTALFALAVAGIGCDLMQDGKLLYLFFLFLGLIFSAGRVLQSEGDQQTYLTEFDRDIVYTRVFRPKVSAKNKGEKSKRKVGAEASFGETEE